MLPRYVAHTSATDAFCPSATAFVAIPLVKLLPPSPLVQIPSIFISGLISILSPEEISSIGIPTIKGLPDMSLRAMSPPLFTITLSPPYFND